MLSCRVQGKFIETALFSHLQVHHNPARARRLRVSFRETSRNQPARLVLEGANFTKLQSGEFVLDFPEDCAVESDIVQVRCTGTGMAELSSGPMAMAEATLVESMLQYWP